MHHKIEQRWLFFFNRQDSVTKPAIGPDSFPLGRNVIIAVTAEASLAGSVTDMIGVGSPPNIHRRPDILPVNLLHLLRCLLQQPRIRFLLGVRSVPGLQRFSCLSVLDCVLAEMLCQYFAGSNDVCGLLGAGRRAKGRL